MRLESATAAFGPMPFPYYSAATTTKYFRSFCLLRMPSSRPPRYLHLPHRFRRAGHVQASPLPVQLMKPCPSCSIASQTQDLLTSQCAPAELPAGDTPHRLEPRTKWLPSCIDNRPSVGEVYRWQATQRSCPLVVLQTLFPPQPPLRQQKPFGHRRRRRQSAHASSSENHSSNS